MNSEIEEVPEHLHFTADNHVHEKMWTAQMTGVHFLKHEYVETDDYLAEDLERIDFTLTDTF
jgi:hypothetical protein